MLQLILLTSPPRSVPLVAGELVLVGRGESCNLMLDDPSASRVHCRLLSRDGRVFLTDAGSRWGTFVNGVRVTECELVPGDEITIGETALRLEATGDARGTTLARRSEIQRPVGLTIASPNSSPEQSARGGDQTPADVSRSQPVASPRGAATPLNPADFMSTEFAGTHIEELLARTRTGLLFRGNRQGRAVAIKLLHPRPFEEEVAKTRFLRAVETTRGLSHPHLVELIDGGICDGIPCAVSEFVDGESAAQMIQRIGVAGMLDWRNTLRIALDIAAALKYLESQGTIHRNVTPQHLLINRGDDRCKLSDLLLAKALDDARPALTLPGEVLGEIAYTSPEQLGSGQPVDQRSDIYQLGATLYALLTGRPPFEGPNAGTLIAQVLNTAPTPATRFHLAIPPLFEGTISTMLEKRPQDRFASASDLLTALGRVARYAG